MRWGNSAEWGQRHLQSCQPLHFTRFVRQSIQRNLDSEDLVGTAIWLASDASAMVTGQTIAVDGGTVFL